MDMVLDNFDHSSHPRVDAAPIIEQTALIEPDREGVTMGCSELKLRTLDWNLVEGDNVRAGARLLVG